MWNTHKYFRLLFLLCPCLTACRAFLLSVPSLTPEANFLVARFSHGNLHHDNEAIQLPHLEFEPSQVALHQVSLRYPVTLARRLFSSVPRREYAVHNVTCHFQSEIVLLQGASSSGKSALMKLIAGQEIPTSGTCTLNNKATPIWLADKPPSFDNQNSVQILLQQEARIYLPQGRIKGDDDIVNFLTDGIAITVAKLVHLVEESQSAVSASYNQLVLTKTPAQLSPSENYKLRLAMACLQSSLPGLSLNSTDNDATTIIRLPAPTLLLDEWLDFETRDTSAKVEAALLEVVQSTGAVIFCATHKPNLWRQLSATAEGNTTTQMTLCRGEILTLKQPTKRALSP